MRRDASTAPAADIQNADNTENQAAETCFLAAVFFARQMKITEYNISLRDIHLYAYHGVMPQENEVGGWYTIDIGLTIADHSCTESDDIAGTVSYADVYEIICREMEKPSALLEHVCNRICGNLYSTFAQIEAIEITLCKDTPPMGGDRLKAAVTLKSRR